MCSPTPAVTRVLGEEIRGGERVCERGMGGDGVGRVMEGERGGEGRGRGMGRGEGERGGGGEEGKER